ncbi:group 1 truncated hemoglobin [soil metagenome]
MRAGMFVMAALLAVAACGGKGKGGGGGGSGVPLAERSLYDRIGGKDAITGMIEDFVANVAADKRISAFFDNADMPGFKQKLVDQICEKTGGPCKYTGKDMKTEHAGMNIKDADYDALVEDLVKSLDKFKVGERERNDLLSALSKMKGDIVTAK